MRHDPFTHHLPFGLIRDARISDSDAILRMVAKLAAHHGDTSLLTAETLARDAFGPNPWICTLVAEMNGELVGYAALCPALLLHFGKRGLDLHHLFAEAECRGHGVGTGLVDACKAKAKALSCAYLTVGTHPDNLDAQAFYERIGFARKDCHPPRFSLQIDA